MWANFWLLVLWILSQSSDYFDVKSCIFIYLYSMHIFGLNGVYNYSGSFAHFNVLKSLFRARLFRQLCWERGSWCGDVFGMLIKVLLSVLVQNSLEVECGGGTSSKHSDIAWLQLKHVHPPSQFCTASVHFVLHCVWLYGCRYIHFIWILSVKKINNYNYAVVGFSGKAVQRHSQF